MNKPNFLTEIVRDRFLTLIKRAIVSLILIVSIVTPVRAEDSFDRTKVVHDTIQNYIQVGDAQYQEGLFEDAVNTYDMALKYKEYLSEQERAQLETKIEKSKSAVAKQKDAFDIFWSAKDLYNKNKLNEAKGLFESIQKNEYLTKAERTEIAEITKDINVRLSADSSDSKESDSALKPKAAQDSKSAPANNDRVKYYADIFKQSQEYYKSGQYEKAKEGYIAVLNSGTIPSDMKKTLQADIAKIDKILAQNAGSNTQQNTISSNYGNPSNEIIQTQMIDSEPVTGAGQQQSYLDSVTERQNTIRDYVKAFNTDTTIKVQQNITAGRFDLAKLAVQDEQLIVNQYQMELGNDLYNQYNTQLKILNEHINTQEQTNAQLNQASKNEAALKDQAVLRQRMETEKKERIANYMADAKENAKLERYDAALGNLKSLLDIDPQNDAALRLKKEIEDNQYFRKQLELKEKEDLETANMLIQTDEARIPYSDLVTYPGNFKELKARKTRQPDKPFGMDENEEAVNRQLNEVVDLSDLTPEMTFSEVLGKIKNSVTPPLQIQPNWRDLADLADILPTTLAELNPLSRVKVRTAIEVLLAGLSSDLAKIKYVVREGVIMIATEEGETLPSNMVQRTYNIADLVGMPSTGGGGGMMGGMMGGGMMGGGMMGGYGGGMMGGSYGGGMMGGSSYGGGMMGGSSYGGGMMGGSYGGGYNTGGVGGGYGGGMMGGSSYGGGMMGGSSYGGGMMGGSSYGGGMMGGYGGGMMGGSSYGGGMMGGYGGGMMGGMMGGGMGGGNTSGELVNLIQQIIEPDTWYDTSDEGEGTIYPYPQMSPKKLAVTNTPEVHAQIEKLLESLRQSLGHQVSIEARILSVSENWLNDVGLDVDFTMNAGGKWGMLEFQQGSILTTAPEPTKVEGSLAATPASMGVAGGYGSILDDLQVSFLLKATQARTDAKSLIAPRATVMDGEVAFFSNQNEVSFVPPPRSTTTVTPTGIGTAATTTDYSPSVTSITVGAPLTVTPTISYDKKYVILNVQFSYSDVQRIRTHTVDYINSAGEVQTYQTSYPEQASTSITTRVSVPDGGTLLLGGQRVSMEVNKEAGVPVLSKIPILNRLFMNRSNIRDQQIMLILVRPTIMLQEESEAEALGEMESLY